MKITLLEDTPNQTTNNSQHQDLSKLKALKPHTPVSPFKKKEPVDVESDWDKKILQGLPETQLDSVQDWIIEKTGQENFKATTPYLKLLLSWMDEFNSTDENKNPLLNLFLSATNNILDKEELPNYDTLVTINNLYASKKLATEDLSGDNKLGVFSKGDLYDRPYKEQERYIQIWKYLVSEDGFKKKLQDLLASQEKLGINPYIASPDDPTKRWYVRDMLKYLDGTTVEKIMMKDPNHFRDLDDIQALVTKIDNAFKSSNYRDKVDNNTLSNKDKNAVYKVIKDKNLSQDDLSILMNLPQMQNEL